MTTDDNTQLLEIFAGSLFQAQMVQNLLENQGIESFLKDEFIGTHSAVWAPSAGVRVMVSDLDLSRAKAIVADYEKNFS
jgi:hypothetical protein